MDLTIDEILKLCRLCQKRPGVFEVLSEQLNEKVYECTRIKVNDEFSHKLPSTICKECTEKIHSFFNFLKEVRNVDLELRGRIIKKDENSMDVIKHEPLICSNINFNIEKLKAIGKSIKFNLQKHTSLYCLTCELTFDDIIERSKHNCENSNNKPKENLLLKNSFIDNEEDKNFIYDERKVKNISVPNKSTVHFGLKDNEKGSNLSQKELDCKVDLVLDKHSHKKLNTKYQCKRQNCNKICTSAYTLKIHEMKHEGKLPFLCVICGKQFNTKNSLNSHEKIHLEIKAFVCKLCNIGYSGKSNLRAHERKYHEGIRFYCSQCTRAYFSKASLERHERIHGGMKEFQCDSCSSAFYTKKELVKHQIYHQGIRQHKCDHCFKSFFEKHHLTIHVRSHTGERPYICKITDCGKSFTESQKLTRHLKARHSSL